LATLRSVTKGRQGRAPKDDRGEFAVGLGDVHTASPRNAKSGKPRRILFPSSRGGVTTPRLTSRLELSPAWRVRPACCTDGRADTPRQFGHAADCESNEGAWTSMVHGLGHGETWGLLSNLGGFVTYQDTYPMNLACNCMYLDVFRCLYITNILIQAYHTSSDNNRDTSQILEKIHRDTSRYICICHFGYHRTSFTPHLREKGQGRKN